MSATDAQPQFYLVTSNQDKLRELQTLLGLPLAPIHLDMAEIQALEVDDVVRAKAITAYQQTGKVVIVEDTSLAFDAWQGLPGALVRWFLQTVGNEGLCRMLADQTNRNAVAKTALALYNGTSMVVRSDEIRGTIRHRPAGARGFGWDPIFQPAGTTQTFAEMTADAKNRLSMRHRAAAKLRRHLLTVAPSIETRYANQTAADPGDREA
ncbi:dITP/XTP pyrophosphatase [Candidatus Entotheonellaceae bacterium PAL068K]